MPRFKEQAICIRHIDWSETSQIVALLTKDHGVIRGVAKGAKRMSPGSIARFSGGIELLTVGQACGLIKPSAELANITEWDLQRSFWHLREDLHAQYLGTYAADLVGSMLAEHDAHPVIFDALCDFLAAIETPAARNTALLRFQWLLLSDCGYQPELHRDVRGDHELPKARSYTFHAREGGFSMDDLKKHDTWKVRRQTLELLRLLSINGDAPPIDEDTASIDRANRLLCVYARAILDRELPTMKFVLGK